MSTSTIQKSESSPNRYGLLTLIAIIVGTVIGSGIYVKNGSLVEQSESIILSTIGWVIGGLIVLSMLVAFIEIVSITNKKKEQGTFTAWSRYLWGERSSKLIGGYFLFIYFPLIMASESIFAANEFYMIFYPEGTGGNEVAWYFIISIIAFCIIAFAFAITSFTVKPGEAIQSFGTVAKILPLLFIIILLFVALGLNGSYDNTLINDGAYDPNSSVNTGLHENAFYNLLLILPAILFAFDGFLFAASLSNEAKSPKTYKRALIIAVFFITLIYLSFSIGCFLLGDGNGANSNYEINGIIVAMFTKFGLETLGNDLQIIITVILMISITTAVFGYSLSSIWTLSDSSNLDEIVDKNGVMIRRNYKGVPTNAGIKMFIYTFVALIIMRLLDGIFLLVVTGSVSTIGMTDYMSNLFTLTNFVMYSLIIIGAIKNRFTNKTETDKQKGFMICAFFSTFMILLSVTSLAYSLIDGLFISQAEDAIILKTISIVIFILAIFITYFFNYWHTKKNIAKNKEFKEFYKYAYNNKIPFLEYLKQHEETKEHLIQYNKYHSMTLHEKLKHRFKNQKKLWKEMWSDFKKWLKNIFKRKEK
ncbi:APC family permease [Candidatus Hepatoplasma crinochetorum]|uniref:Serine/threonine exchanger SteT n=1 Tax=Candidatus Hepatoplasma crinochetorum Av TaxID=1427984 RepID=W8GJE4_9MOLU|nr:APC family permease [Candidatus Hepatoplasma crinochetorum]AHK22367.1 Serine/threonine exchanger SteT [Candidatus Hepatoplasma crinochetorum Av]BDV02955.1 MAG: putrescine/ornithine APC transporter [Candidatus Hepatoplasma crinochetorum]